MTQAPRDDNRIATLLGVSSLDLKTPVLIATNPTTGAILIDGPSLYTTLDARYVNVTGDTMTGNLVISNTAPSLVLTDTTTSAKSLTIVADANIVDLKESAGASGSLMVLDLTNNRVGIGTTSSTVKLEVTGSIATGTIGTEEEFKLSRPINAGTSFQQVTSFALGSYAANGIGNGYGPSTRLDIKLKSLPNSDLIADATVMTLLSNLNVGIGTTSPTSLLDVSSATGGILTLSRADTTATAADNIGTIQFWNNDSQLTTQNIFANIVVTATSTVITNAAAGTMKINVTGSTAGGSPIEHIAFAPTTVAQIGFFGASPVVKPTALTSQLTTLTYIEPGTPDYAIQTVQLVGYGFATADEGNSVLKVIANLQTRVSELESKLQGLGLLT